MASLKKEQLDAATAFVGVAIAVLKDEHGVHAETAVAGVARMAGTFLFRSFDFPLDGIAPGQAVLSDKANVAGPPLVQLLGGVIEKLEVPVDPSKVDAGTKDAPKPSLSFLETQKKLEPEFTRIKERQGLTYPEAAEAAVVATGMLIQKTSEVLDPTAAFGLAVYGFIEGSKTAPAPVAE